MRSESDATTLAEHFFGHVTATPNKTAFICGNELITWGDAGTRVAAIARGLVRDGLQRGMPALLVARNHPDTACAYLAVHAAGGVAALIDERSPAPDVRARQAAIDARFVIADPAWAPRNSEIAARSIASLAKDQQGTSFKPVCSLDDPADILFTSGSTGRPKAVVLSQAAILAAARQITAVTGQTADDIELVAVPLSHSFGLGRLRCMVLIGNTLVLEPELRDPASAVLRLLQLKATGFAHVPAGFEMIRRLSRDRLGGAADHLRYIEIGSAPMQPATRAWLTKLLPRTKIYHHYGMTEASRAVFTEYHRDADCAESIGLPAPGVEVLILDPQGNPLPAGAPGEIAIRGKMLMNGYLGEAPLDPGTPLRSGDLGWRDAGGFIYLKGRIKDIINVGGLKVMPEEVENTLAELGGGASLGIADFAITGVPDRDRVTGEAVAFAYCAQADIVSAQLRAMLLQRLESYKVPTCFIRLPAIPRAGNGKVLRAELHTMVTRTLTDGS
jgi:long-chain acyl-CoA synthetase